LEDDAEGIAVGLDVVGVFVGSCNANGLDDSILLEMQWDLPLGNGRGVDSSLA